LSKEKNLGEGLAENPYYLDILRGVYPERSVRVQNDKGDRKGMAKKANARRYAQAVFEIALEKNELGRWQADLQKVVAAVSDGDFLAALESPKIKFEDKSRFIKKRLGDISPLAFNLVQLLVSRLSIGIVPAVAREYKSLLDEHRGVKAADVITAVGIDDNEKNKLTAKLGELVDAKVEITSQINPDILGGVVVRVGGKLLDGSTRSKLAALKRELEGGERKG
jgi:F-type H+-transporting ATPase subunit delta